MNENLLNFFDEIEVLAVENHDLIDIVCGYCKYNIDEGCNNGALTTVLQIIKEKQEKIIDTIDENSTKFHHELLT